MSHALVARRAAEPQPLPERLHHPIHRRMLPVLRLDPELRPAALVGPVAMFRDEALQPHVACSTEEVQPDLALFERIDEQALRPARQQTFEVDLAEVQRQLAQIVVALDQDVERAELDLMVVLAPTDTAVRRTGSPR